MSTTNRSEDIQASTDGGSKPSPKIIKRYSNRKLYDTERSKYVTLDEIAQMIKAGEEVTIIDNESKEDLTSVTLTQIIFEEEKRQSRMPLGMLRNLIQSSGDALQDFFDRSVKAPVVEIKDTAEKRVEELRHGVEELKEAATRSVSEWTDTALRVFNRGDAEKRAEEFKRGYTAALDELTKSLETRIHEATAANEHVAHVDAAGAATDGTAAEGTTTEVRHPGELHLREDIDALRARIAQVNGLIDQLEQKIR
ncbi:polyhydroxyalkanoate synthesis regulator DNA-binding domain-containing protein [Myxococcota bacterium]|nr:polyhydroxyalkanoate synthesis regulator DNA-binding domain-containing protein [Myxococcota bacterium]